MTNDKWLKMLDRYANALLYHLDINELAADIVVNRSNIIIDRLMKDPLGFIQAAEAAGKGKVNIDGIGRLVVIAQMLLYDHISGPEMDGKPKGLRRHWYAYFKQFSQMLAFALGKTRKNDEGNDEMIDVQWSGRLSKIYAAFVDSGAVTYRDMWVEDASRMMNIFDSYDRLFPGFQLILAVEKDSLFGDFVQAAKAMGAMAIISGKGKNSKAAAELMLRRLGWGHSQWSNNLGDHPTLVIHLSDHDFDGEAVIGPTFAEQLRRYLDDVREARIGVKPSQVEQSVDSPWDASYALKTSNEGYSTWAYEKALFWATCSSCNHSQYVIGLGGADILPNEDVVTGYECDQCSGALIVTQEDLSQPHGFEVESLRTAEYYKAIVDAVCELLPFEEIVVELRNEARPSEGDVLSALKRQLLEQLSQYQMIDAAINTLQNAQWDLQTKFNTLLETAVPDAVEATEDEWWNDGNDPSIDDLKDHVVSSARSGYASPYRPFNTNSRVEIVIDHVKQDESLINELKSLSVDDYSALIDTVIRKLNGEKE